VRGLLRSLPDLLVTAAQNLGADTQIHHKVASKEESCWALAPNGDVGTQATDPIAFQARTREGNVSEASAEREAVSGFGTGRSGKSGPSAGAVGSKF
jgi:hypothetical protein